jgi:hypothetical protein
MPSASFSTCRALSVPEPPSEASAEKGNKERDHAKVRAILVRVSALEAKLDSFSNEQTLKKRRQQSQEDSEKE